MSDRAQRQPLLSNLKQDLTQVGMMADQSNNEIPASISTADFERELQATLDRLESWHETTQNPLYAWEAIDLCLRMSPSPTFPVWCLAVLSTTVAFYAGF